MADDDAELAERVAQLETSVEQLRAELRRPPRGPLGLPRPPTPREFLGVARSHGIPAAIAALEAQIRALELLRELLRVAEAGERAGHAERSLRSGPSRARVEAVGEAALDRLSSTLETLEASLDDRDAVDPEVRELLTDARELNEEIRDRLAAAAGGEEGVSDASDVPAPTDDADSRADDASGVGDGATPEESHAAGDAVEIDVEAELESIRREVRDRDGGRGDDGTGSRSDGNQSDERRDSEDPDAGGDAGDEDRDDAES